MTQPYTCYTTRFTEEEAEKVASGLKIFEGLEVCVVAMQEWTHDGWTEPGYHFVRIVLHGDNVSRGVVHISSHIELENFIRMVQLMTDCMGRYMEWVVAHEDRMSKWDS